MNAFEHRSQDPVQVPCIGVVESSYRKVTDRMDYHRESRIRIHPQYIDGFHGIDAFSHLWVIYHQHLSQEWAEAHDWGQGAPLIVPDADSRAGQGIYTTRAPCRPSRLGSCIVELIGRTPDRLVVKGLDALHGTQVLDIKIYIPAFDCFPEARIPGDWSPCAPPGLALQPRASKS